MTTPMIGDVTQPGRWHRPGHGRQGEYVADIHLPDVLDAKLVTLDCARARIIVDRRRPRRSRCPACASS